MELCDTNGRWSNSSCGIIGRWPNFLSCGPNHNLNCVAILTQLDQMANEKLRRQIAWDAAQMIRAGQEAEYQSARMKAARRIARGWVPEEDLPSDEEIRNLVQSIAAPMVGDRFDY